MSIKNKKHAALIRIIFIFLIFLSIVIAVTSFISYQLALQDAQKYLRDITQRVKEDIKYEDGKWDTTKYNADSNIPDINPLYVISSDGFVIERWKPINGLLDVVEFMRLLAYDKPTTIQTITNENWRILSQPIKNNERIVGVISVSAYKPELNGQDEIDKDLKFTLDTIGSQLRVNGDEIDITNVDERQIPYNITFQIVNRFNKLLYQNSNTSSISRSPSFIDNSYVDMQMKQERERIVKDGKSGREYLVMTVPLHDSNSSLVGIIVAGYPIDKILSTLYMNLITFFAVSLILGFILLPLINLTLNKFREDLTGDLNNFKLPVNKISFHKEQCKIIIDDQSIDIPYASFQYYFCIALFSKPYKKWETDELLDKFGEQINKNNWRKVYDAMTALNRKTEKNLNDKLFVVKNKTFNVNPLYASKIATIK